MTENKNKDIKEKLVAKQDNVVKGGRRFGFAV